MTYSYVLMAGVAVMASTALVAVPAYAEEPPVRPVKTITIKPGGTLTKPPVTVVGGSLDGKGVGAIGNVKVDLGGNQLTDAELDKQIQAANEGTDFSPGCMAIMRDGLRAKARGDAAGVKEAGARLEAEFGANNCEVQETASIDYTEKNPKGNMGVSDVGDIVQDSMDAAKAAGLEGTQLGNPLTDALGNATGLSGLGQGGGLLSNQNLSQMLSSVAMQALQGKDDEDKSGDGKGGKGENEPETNPDTVLCGTVTKSEVTTKSETVLGVTVSTATLTETCNTGLTRVTTSVTTTDKDGKKTTKVTKVYE